MLGLTAISDDWSEAAWLNRRVATWITDIRDLPGEDAGDAPAAARRRATFTRAVAQAATSRAPEGPWASAVKCIARVARKVCGGHIEVSFAPDRGEVAWRCLACGEDGVISGFAGSEDDLSRYVPQGKAVLWGVDDEEREVLWEATRYIPELRAVIARAKPHGEIAALLLVRATVAELDQVYTLVEDLTDGTKSRRRRELLDGLRASLCNSMDGF